MKNLRCLFLLAVLLGLGAAVGADTTLSINSTDTSQISIGGPHSDYFGVYDLTSTYTQFDLRPTGKTATARVYSTGAVAMLYVSVDGGAYATVNGTLTNALEDLTLFTGGADATHNVRVRFVSNGTLIAKTAFIKVTGSAPACTYASGFAASYDLPASITTAAPAWLALEGPMRTSGVGNGGMLPAFAWDQTGGDIVPGTDQRIRWKMAAGSGTYSVLIFAIQAGNAPGASPSLVILSGTKFAYERNGTRIATAQTLSGENLTQNAGGGAQWLTIASGVDATSAHDCAIHVINNPADGAATQIMIVGGTISTSPIASRTYYAYFGDSISVAGNSTTNPDSATGYVAKTGAAANVAIWNFGRGFNRVGSYGGVGSNCGVNRTYLITSLSPAPARLYILYGTNDMLNYATDNTHSAGPNSHDETLAEFTAAYASMLATLLIGVACPLIINAVPDNATTYTQSNILTVSAVTDATHFVVTGSPSLTPRTGVTLTGGTATTTTALRGLAATVASVSGSGPYTIVLSATAGATPVVGDVYSLTAPLTPYYNDAIKSVIAGLSAANQARITYVDTQGFLNVNTDLLDGTHPNDKGFDIITAKTVIATGPLASAGGASVSVRRGVQ